MAIENEGLLRPFLVPILNALLDDTLTAADKTECSLVSAALYGSAAGGDFVEKKSDVNVLLIFDRVDLDLLNALRAVFKKHFPKLKAYPVVTDREYIIDSTDVFPMEFLEWKERNILIYGDDLLKDVEISLKNLRLEIEENLRGKKLRLIQSYFEIPPGKGRIQDFIEATMPNFIVAFRNLLRLSNAPIPEDTQGVFREVGRLAGVRLSNFNRLHHIKSQGLRIKPPETEILFKGYLQEIDAIIEYVDGFDSNSNRKK